MTINITIHYLFFHILIFFILEIQFTIFLFKIVDGFCLWSILYEIFMLKVGIFSIFSITIAIVMVVVEATIVLARFLSYF